MFFITQVSPVLRLDYYGLCFSLKIKTHLKYWTLTLDTPLFYELLDDQSLNIDLVKLSINSSKPKIMNSCLQIYNKIYQFTLIFADQDFYDECLKTLDPMEDMWWSFKSWF